MGTMHEVIFEFVRIGSSVKVTAIDPLTGTEASIVGTLAAGELALKRLAAQKLNYVLKKKSPSPDNK